MGRYLNSQTREDTVVIAGVSEMLKDIISRWNSNMKKPPKEVLNYLGASSRFAFRALKEFGKELDDVELERIYKMGLTAEFNYVKYDLSSKNKEPITYDITDDERDNLVEALAEVRCKNCNGCVEDCTVRNQFFKWDVTPIHDVTDDIHPCQYIPPV
jgi:hypothetical protein